MGIHKMSFKKFKKSHQTVTVATTATNKPELSDRHRLSPCHRPAPLEEKKVEWHFADILALPIRSCTTCTNLTWQSSEYEADDGSIQTRRFRSCLHYSRLADPRKGCRCVHYRGLH